MLSHLRFHRRAPSNPSSPGPDQPTHWDGSPSQSQHPPFPQDGGPNPDNRPSSANPSLLPPSLPPVSRVTSSDSEPQLDMQDLESTMTQDPRQQQPLRSPYNGDSGFIGGVALRNYRRGQQATARRPESAGNTSAGTGAGSHESHISKSKPMPPPIVTTGPARPPPQPLKYVKPASSFVTPTDLHSQNQNQNQNLGYPAAGKRPAGTRLTSEPPTLAMASYNGEVPKGKKGLPFLKNPMSTLLARRKTSQNAPDLLPLPLAKRKEEPSYDPRIRGTRIHDFSAPRPKRFVSSNDIANAGQNTRVEQPRIEEKEELARASQQDSFEPLTYGQHARNRSNASDSGLSLSASVNSAQIQTPETSNTASSKTRRGSDLEQKPLPGQPPVVPPKDQTAMSIRSLSTASRIASGDALASLPKSNPSARTTSRRISLSDASGKDILSSVPRHMKSTSSRFSFDMIGAAKQEKLLEERHRQRELEKKTADPDPQRDSRFDDFDDDGFDYDAMMDDDGLEERIPGVNADYEDEYEEEFAAEMEQEAEPDPDNDQENFAGFVFERSNPTSALASPRSAGMLSTPRDNDGKVIGFAMTKDTTPDLHPVPSPGVSSEQTLQPNPDDSVTGLAIQGLDINVKAQKSNLAAFNQNHQVPPVDDDHHEDDLYYDDGLINEVNGFRRDSFGGEGDGTYFDESIFDNVDTDQYGRPIPGAFAMAQSSRTATQDHSKRVSDSTSRMSAQSGTSQSTTHTSVSTGIQHYPSTAGPKRENDEISASRELPAPIPGFPASETEKMAVYQAALAAAAHKAAANGKFRRDSSPPPSELRLPDGESTNDLADNSLPDDYEDYDDDLYPHDNLDDYELDDDAIIAEANASALANDSDGWYGQEFGFYSAPVNQQHHSRDSSNSSNGGKDFEFANGGFFGPSGVSRTISGRMVSREPNLTPITERSEYSNRNSIMSLSVPPLGSGTSNLFSPGLAQLAMMADGDDNMTLSALLRLRTRAWGGSQASLVSSKEGSPRSERGDGSSSPWGPGAGNILGIHSGHGRKNSTFSILSRDSDAGSAGGSPTLTMSMPIIGSPPPPIPPARDLISPASVPTSQFSQHQPFPYQSLMETDKGEDYSASASMSNSGIWMKSPDTSMHPNVVVRSDVPAPLRRPGMGHKHKGSADSISYIKEEDSGETRWVVERRRTADTGEIEVEREVLERGRI